MAWNCRTAGSPLLKPRRRSHTHHHHTEDHRCIGTWFSLGGGDQCFFFFYHSATENNSPLTLGGHRYNISDLKHWGGWGGAQAPSAPHLCMRHGFSSFFLVQPLPHSHSIHRVQPSSKHMAIRLFEPPNIYHLAPRKASVAR